MFLNPLSAIAKMLKISRTTLYKALPELLTPEQAKTRLSTQLRRPATRPAGIALSRGVRPAAHPRSPLALTAARIFLNPGVCGGRCGETYRLRRSRGCRVQR